jgi:hypothetical protein
MKWLLFCALANAGLLDTSKFVIGDKVKYTPPHVYSKVCSGFATIRNVEVKNKRLIYTIETEGSPCPLFYEVSENAIEGVKS